jgi:GT2 family glycosyltransferase
VPDTPGAEPVLTVIVLNYNGAHLLPPCLDALAKQDMPDGSMQVWVVDNDSRKDDSVAMLARDYPWVRVIQNDHNAGFGGGNNVGMRQATTPFIALTNNDARPDPDWARQLIRPLQEDPTGRIAAVSGKIVFLPRFVELSLGTPAFRPGSVDGRELGVRIYKVRVNGQDVTEHVLWEGCTYGPEGEGEARFRWTRPRGTLFVPTNLDGSPMREGLEITLAVAAEAAKRLTLEWQNGRLTAEVDTAPTELSLTLPADVPQLDVINNVGSIVTVDGYGADRGYQQVDRGQYSELEDVFAFCGGSVAFRREALLEVGYFDDNFFMYYEDTDLSWRFRSAGWRVVYEPGSVTRHIHSASSVEWSPFFTFHVDLNRLLMLTKNATPNLASREVLRYPATTLSLAAREIARSRHTRRRPAVRPILLRIRVFLNYLRLLARMLGQRRSPGKHLVVSRGELQQRWLVKR